MEWKIGDIYKEEVLIGEYNSKGELEYRRYYKEYEVVRVDDDHIICVDIDGNYKAFKI